MSSQITSRSNLLSSSRIYDATGPSDHANYMLAHKKMTLDRMDGLFYNSIVEYWSKMSLPTNVERDLIILEHIEQDPDTSQAALASQLEVAVGTVNWHLKRLIEKGYVKVSRLERKKLKYIITPEGLLFRARLTVDYIQNSFNLYRLVRQRAITTLDQIKALGYNEVCVRGDDEVAEICRLTCLEQGISVVEDGSAPVLKMVGLKVILETKEQA